MVLPLLFRTFAFLPDRSGTLLLESGVSLKIITVAVAEKLWISWFNCS